jgi:hypothetical protein
MGRVSERHKRLHDLYYSDTDGPDSLAKVADQSLRNGDENASVLFTPPRTNRSIDELVHPSSPTSPSKDKLMMSTDTASTQCESSPDRSTTCSSSTTSSLEYSLNQVMFDDECPEQVVLDDSFPTPDDRLKQDTSIDECPTQVTFDDEYDNTICTLAEGEQDQRTLRLYIDDFQKPAFTRIVASLAEKKTLRQLVIHRGSEGSASLGSRSAEELQELFDALLVLPNLKSLVLWNFGQGDSKLLDAVLRQHNTLLNFQLHLTSGAADDDLLRALASASALKQVNLLMNKSFPVGEVLKSKTIQALRVISKSYAFNDDHLLGLIEALRDHNTLETLDLEPAISSLSFQTLASGLWTNKRLETLKLSYASDVKTGSASVLELSKLLNVNSNLKEVWNHSFADLKVSRRCQVYALETLEENSTLKKFHLFEEHADFSKQKEETLRRNSGGRRRKRASVCNGKWWNLTDTICLDELGAMAKDEFRCLDELGAMAKDEFRCLDDLGERVIEEFRCLDELGAMVREELGKKV